MRIKTTVLAAAAFAAAALSASTPPGFTDDYDAALARAAAEKKPILAVFSGSDWCYWCKKLEKDFLSKKEFTEAVTNDIVCLFVDSPQDNSVLSEKAREANPKLVAKYAIRGFPTLLFLGAKGETLGPVERQDMTPAAWGRLLATEARQMPLVLKHLQPFQNRANALLQSAQAKFAALEGRPMADEAKKTEAEKIVKDFKKEIADLRKEVEASEMPEELKELRAQFLLQLDRYKD